MSVKKRKARPQQRKAAGPSIRRLPEAQPARPFSSGPDTPQLLVQAKVAPHAMKATGARQLQRAIGNRAVGGLLQGAGQGGNTRATSDPTVSLKRMMANRQLQASLSVGPVGDAYEREAEAVSARVVSGMGNGAKGRQQEWRRMAAPAAPAISRSAADAAAGPVAPAFERGVEKARGGGQRLADETRKPMERAFGADFSGVKVHADDRADKLSRAVQARAFTTGQDLFFRKGEFNPAAQAGKRLLAHELTHVVQQNGPGVRAQPGGSADGRLQRAATPLGSAVNWGAATEATPSGAGGKGGVMFVKVGGVTHVVKAVQGTAATAMFGEQMVSAIGGAGTTRSIPVEANSPEGQDILTQLRYYGIVARAGDNEEMKERWAEKLPFFESATYFLIQRAMNPAQEAGRVMTQNPISILGNPQRMFNAGKLLAADTLIGNADRWEQLNLGNLFLGAGDTMEAIDTDALLQNWAEGKRLDVFGGDVSTWTGGLIRGQSELQEAGAKGAAAPSSSLKRVLTDFNDWFDSIVKGLITNPAPRWGRYYSGLIPDNFDWDGARAHMKRGLDAGLAAGYALLTQPGKPVKADFQDYERAYGGDMNFDWQAFKAKAMYAKMVYEGIEAEQAEEKVTAYYEQYKQGFKSGAWVQQWANVAHWDPTLENVPARPAAMEKKEKAKRALTLTGIRNKKEAKALKKYVRDRANWSLDKIDAKLPELAQKANLDRRFNKAYFEARYIRYLIDQSMRESELDGLRTGIDKLQADAKGASPTAAKIAAKLLLAPNAAMDANTLRTIVLTKYKEVSIAYRRNYAVMEAQENEIVTTDRKLNLDVRQAVDKLEAAVRR